MSVGFSCSISRFFTSSSGTKLSKHAPNQPSLPLHAISLSSRFEDSSWTIEKKDSQGHKLQPLPFINKNGLSFINGYRQFVTSKLSALGIDEISTKASSSSSFVSKALMPSAGQTHITLSHWLSLLAAGSNVISESLKVQYVSQLINLEFFLSSLKQPKYSHLEPMGIPSIADLHANPNGLPENVVSSIGRTFGSIDEFKKMFENVGLAFFGGSGWLWLVENREGRLKIIITLQAGTPFLFDNHHDESQQHPLQWPILGLSLWEHAYLPTHSFNRASYLRSFWDAVDWNEISRRLGGSFLEKWK